MDIWESALRPVAELAHGAADGAVRRWLEDERGLPSGDDVVSLLSDGTVLGMDRSGRWVVVVTLCGFEGPVAGLDSLVRERVVEGVASNFPGGLPAVRVVWE